MVFHVSPGGQAPGSQTPRLRYPLSDIFGHTSREIGSHLEQARNISQVLLRLAGSAADILISPQLSLKDGPTEATGIVRPRTSQSPLRERNAWYRSSVCV